MGGMNYVVVEHNSPDEEDQQSGNQEVGCARPEHPDFL